MRMCFGALGWLLALVIVLLSVVPASYRPVTGAPSFAEHAGIYLAMGAAFAVGYRDRISTVVVGLLTFAGLIEFIQIWVPGRHARLTDLQVDSAGAGVGVLAILMARRSASLKKLFSSEG
jgi:VanZ family protein